MVLASPGEVLPCQVILLPTAYLPARRSFSSLSAAFHAAPKVFVPADFSLRWPVSGSVHRNVKFRPLP